jgi:hypothetical protein
VKLKGDLSYHDWCEGIRRGANYVSDGRSHLLDFKVNETPMGENGSELQLTESTSVHATAQVAAYLDEKPSRELAKRAYSEKPYWDIERARIGDARKVPVELVVNGYPVARQEFVADGSLREVSFDVPLKKSSWVAMRILASSHTNPIFVLVDGKPIRASARSAEWCLEGVDKCWAQKERFIKSDEIADAKEAYEHARVTYRRLVGECKANGGDDMAVGK